ncbi:hypothetical protein RDI58_019922 [Solanum bulbocastanum]|uniref:DUF4283 domain-containing protein n=1 Tax=Solanum bulbocastanum TaxID=147425 RepID=A0AAN8Y833_SOLBU
MTKYVTKVWGIIDKCLVLFHGDAYNIFRFQNIEDKEKVIQSGRYFYKNKQVILRQWEIEFDFEEDMTRKNSYLGQILYVASSLLVCGSVEQSR